MEWNRSFVDKVNLAYCENVVVGSDHVHPHSNEHSKTNVGDAEHAAQAASEMNQHESLRTDPVERTVM